MSNEVAVLQDLFRKDAPPLRHGPAETLPGRKRIAAFRAGRSPVELERTLENTVITTHGQDVATANTGFRRGRRESQTRVRFPEGWRTVAADVPPMPLPDSAP